MGETILTQVQKKILSLLAKDEVFTKHFYLTGGTALAWFYLHHRYSEDLDFFSHQEIDSLWLIGLAKKLKLEIKAQKVDIQQSFNRNLVFFTLNKKIVKTEFTYFPFEQIEKPRLIKGIKVDSLLDIAVNKFLTIYQQPAARHFIDLYFVLKEKKISWERLEKLTRIKFDIVIDPIQLGSQLITAQDLSDLPKMIVKLPAREWKEYFLKKAKGLKNKITT